MASTHQIAADSVIDALPRTNWGAKVSPPPAPSHHEDDMPALEQRENFGTFVGEHKDLLKMVGSSTNTVLKNWLTRALVSGYLVQAIALYRAHETVVNAAKEEEIEDTRIGVAVAIYASMHIGFSAFIGAITDKEYTEENPGDTLAQVAVWLENLMKQFKEIGAVIERAWKEENDK